MLVTNKILQLLQLHKKPYKWYDSTMRKRLLNGATLILIGIMIALGVMIVLNFTRISIEFQVGPDYSSKNPPLYRYMTILDGSDESFMEDIIIGMDKASEDYSVVYELWSFTGVSKEEAILRQLDIGIESKVNGILIQAFQDERFADLLVKAKRNNVPIITIGEDVPSQEKVSFVSYNKYQMGSRIGSILRPMLARAGKEKGTIAIIQNSPLFDQDQAFAIQEELEDGFIVTPITVNNVSERILNAEGLAKAIIDEYDDLAAFICLNGEETLGVVYALKEANMIEEVIIIGSDDDEEILDFISRGVVEATIVADIENIGYEGIFDLTKYNDGLFVTQYRDIGVKIVDKENLPLYLEEEGEE